MSRDDTERAKLDLLKNAYQQEYNSKIQLTVPGYLLLMGLIITSYFEKALNWNSSIIALLILTALFYVIIKRDILDVHNNQILNIGTYYDDLIKNGELPSFSELIKKKSIPKNESKNNGPSDLQVFWKWVYLIFFFLSTTIIANQIEPFLGGPNILSGIFIAAVLLFSWALLMTVITKIFRLNRGDPFGILLNAQYNISVDHEEKKKDN